MGYKNLPALRSKDLIRVLLKIGFVKDRQKGSHLVLIHPIFKKRTVIPLHSGKTIKKPLLRSIIVNDARMSIEEFLDLL